MRTLKLFFAVALVAVFSAPVAPAFGKVAETLADYPLTALDGSKTKLSSYRGDVVVVNFWASWCAPCRKELPVMNDWHAKWAGRGARVVAISIDKEARNAKRFAEKQNLSMNLFHDAPSGLARKLDLPSVPCTFLLDRSGKVVGVIEGSSEKELAALHKQVESLLSSSRAVRATAAPGSDGGSQ